MQCHRTDAGLRDVYDRRIEGVVELREIRACSVACAAVSERKGYSLIKKGLAIQQP